MTIKQKILKVLEGRKRAVTSDQVTSAITARWKKDVNAASVKRELAYLVEAGSVTSTGHAGRGKPAKYAAA